MNFDVRPGFVHKKEEPRYFVRPLDAQDQHFGAGCRWQIQFLNDREQGAACLDFGPEDESEVFDLLAVDLPNAVIDAAKSGISACVDGQGRQREPGFLGGGIA
jgi:hypothetical protein